jgi:hypothetical protein
MKESISARSSPASSLTDAELNGCRPFAAKEAPSITTPATPVKGSGANIKATPVLRSVLERGN